MSILLSGRAWRFAILGSLVALATLGNWSADCLASSPTGAVQWSEATGGNVPKPSSLRARAQIRVPGRAAPAAKSNKHVVFKDYVQGAPQWSQRTVSDTPDGRKYLGPFHNQTVTLSLEKLPKHAWVKMRCKLYVRGTWDGNSPLWGPDLWSLSARGGPRLIFASFCNMGYFSDNNAQSYPDDYPTATHPAWTGAAARQASAHHPADDKQSRNDGVYNIEVVFPHAGSSLKLDFSGIYDDAEAEQCWGLGDVEVSVATDAPTHDPSVLPRLWEELGGADSVKANAALWQFVGAGDAAIQFLSEKVRAVETGSATANSLQMRRAQRVVRIVGGAEKGALRFKMECLFGRLPPPPAATEAKPAVPPAPAVKRPWGPEQATGEPDTPTAGDIQTAWASPTPDGQDESDERIARLENEVRQLRQQITILHKEVERLQSGRGQ